MRSILLMSILLLTTIKISGQTINKNTYIFGHSLIDHRPPANPTPSDETTVPHWIYLLAQDSNHGFAAGGQYGFLPQHANLPPFSQWGYDIVPGVWDSEQETFADANINTILITAGNFIQYQNPNLPYEDPNNVDQVSPVSATEKIVDCIAENTEQSTIYIYENWPDMASALGDGSFPPNDESLSTYHEYTRNDFHAWWIEYQDLLIASRPTDNVRMIPVGPAIAEISERYLGDMPVTELYEDDAPHGRANIYFLAGLISYMSMYEEKAPSNFTLPELIGEAIKNQYVEIVDFIWDYLVNFKDDQGNSRVFSGLVSSAKEEIYSNTVLYPNPAAAHIQLQTEMTGFEITVRNINGVKVMKCDGALTSKMDIAQLGSGIYFMELRSMSSGVIEVLRFIKL